MKRLIMLMLFITIAFVSTAQKYRNGIQDYSTIVSLRAENQITPKQNDKVVVIGTKGIFTWDATSIAVDDGQTIIKQTNIATGRWIGIGGVPPNVRYGTTVPSILGTDKIGDEYLRTSSGTNSTPASESYIYDGTVWKLNPVITSSNGLTTITNNIKLGGSLIENTDIVTGAFNIGVGTDAGTGNINLGTGAGARNINIGNSVGTTGVSAITGTTGMSLTGTNTLNATLNVSNSTATNGATIFAQSTSTAKAAGSSVGLLIGSGALATPNIITNSLNVQNLHTGTGLTNVGLRVQASGATNNYAIIAQAGLVGFQTISPVNTLHIGTAAVTNTGGIRLPITSASAVQTGQPIGVDANGDIIRIAPVAGGVTTLNTQTGATQTLSVTNTTGTQAWTSTANNHSLNLRAWDLIGNTGTVQSTNFVGTTDNVGLSFRTNNAIRQTIDPLGNIGIGLIAPVDKLHVTGGNIKLGEATSIINPAIKIHSSANVDNAGGRLEFNEFDEGFGYTIRHNTGTGTRLDGLWFEAKSANVYTPVFGIAGTGNVGINTTLPLNRLHIGGTFVAGTAGIRVPITSASPSTAGSAIGVDVNGDIVKIADATSSAWSLLGNNTTVQATNFIGTTNNVGLSIRTNNTIRQTIDATGNVGINTIAPISTLDIAGSIGTNYVTTVTATYTALNTDHTIRLANGALQTLTLPAANTVDRREYVIANTTGFVKAFAASVTGLNGAATTVIPASSSITVKSIGSSWVIVEQSSVTSGFPTTLTTTTTTGTVNITNTTYMQLTGVPAGTYDCNYRITIANTDATNRIWATGLTTNNAAQSFSAGADAVATILGTLAVNHPFTVSGYNRLVLGATGTIEVKGQIYNSQVTAPTFAGVNRLTCMRVL